MLTADKTGLMETPPVTLDLLCVVHCLFTSGTLGTTSPVWHLGGKSKKYMTEAKLMKLINL